MLHCLVQKHKQLQGEFGGGHIDGWVGGWAGDLNQSRGWALGLWLKGPALHAPCRPLPR